MVMAMMVALSLVCLVESKVPVIGESRKLTNLPPGFNSRNTYESVAQKFVGSQQILSFSHVSASASSTDGISAEALCNCECNATANFVACFNTAKTTVGVSTFSVDPYTRRWTASALRVKGNVNYFEKGSLPGATIEKNICAPAKQT
jgi:hypothetical protein